MEVGYQKIGFIVALMVSIGMFSSCEEKKDVNPQKPEQCLVNSIHLDGKLVSLLEYDDQGRVVKVHSLKQEKQYAYFENRIDYTYITTMFGEVEKMEGTFILGANNYVIYDTRTKMQYDYDQDGFLVKTSIGDQTIAVYEIENGNAVTRKTYNEEGSVIENVTYGYYLDKENKDNILDYNFAFKSEGIPFFGKGVKNLLKFVDRDGMKYLYDYKFDNKGNIEEIYFTFGTYTYNYECK